MTPAYPPAPATIQPGMLAQRVPGLRQLRAELEDLRKRNDRGHHGALHAKCVLVDSERLFVSSANMTEFALMLNMELGVLLEGGDAPRQVERNLTELIRTGVFREFQSAA